jgi:hypothetical protein
MDGSPENQKLRRRRRREKGKGAEEVEAVEEESAATVRWETKT